MPFNIEYDQDEDCIVATFIGEIGMTTVKEYIAALLPVLESTGCRRVLSDSRNGELKLTSLDIMQFPKMAKSSPLTAGLRRAVLARQGRSGYDLYATLCNLQGQQVKVFSSRTEAMKWLRGDEE
ncbi:hypothetical protein P4B35_02605 [Pontiellaceae bacterium B12227]|nr:hypothetical protein [Pontiellaceae bacterium B12227]